MNVGDTDVLIEMRLPRLEPAEWAMLIALLIAFAFVIAGAISGPLN